MTNAIGPQPASAAQLYRRRFESSVLGSYVLMPEAGPELEQFQKKLVLEKPKAFPSGPNTRFSDPTPMPYRFVQESVTEQNKRLDKVPPVHPCYATTTSEYGRLGISPSDMPMRWYGLEGKFTTQFYLGGATPTQRVGSGLVTGLERSQIHSRFDQGYSGHLGLRDHNIASLAEVRKLQRRP